MVGGCRRLGGPQPYAAVNVSEIPDSPPGSPRSQKARVIYDYDAKDSTELTLFANEVILNIKWKQITIKKNIK